MLGLVAAFGFDRLRGRALTWRLGRAGLSRCVGDMGYLLLQNDGAPLIQPNQVELFLPRSTPIVEIGSSVF
jgi:hypothetical protein